MMPGELERLNTWSIEIVETLIENVRWRQEGDERRVLGSGGLTINVRKGCWFSHSADKGGVSVLPLIQLLKACNSKDAQKWGTAWLKSHAGTGSAVPDDNDYGREIDNAIIAQDIIDRLVD